MGRLRLLGVVLAAFAVMLVAVQTQAAVPHAKPPVVVHLTFRRLARNVEYLEGSGRYVGYTHFDGDFVLIDDQTGKQTTVPDPCSDPGTLGFPWVGFYCGPSFGTSFRLYNLQTHKWRRVACDAVCRRYTYSQSIRVIGAKWFVEVDPHEPCGDGVHYSCGPTTYSFYNIDTGRRRSPPTGAGTIIDLNSSSLKRRVCQPLQVPPGQDSAFPPPLTFFGSFAEVEDPSGIYLEKCGSRLRLPLVTTPYAGLLLGSTDAVGFCTFGGGLNGYFLPSLRSFKAALPAETGCPAALGTRHIFANGSQSTLLAAAFPAKSKSTGTPR